MPTIRTPEQGPAAEAQTAARPRRKKAVRRQASGKGVGRQASGVRRAVAAAAAQLDPCPFYLALAVYVLAAAVVIATAIGLAQQADGRRRTADGDAPAIYRAARALD